MLGSLSHDLGGHSVSVYEVLDLVLLKKVNKWDGYHELGREILESHQPQILPGGDFAEKAFTENFLGIFLRDEKNDIFPVDEFDEDL